MCIRDRNSTGVLEGLYDIEIKYVGYKTEVRRKAVSYTHLDVYKRQLSNSIRIA